MRARKTRDIVICKTKKPFCVFQQEACFCCNTWLSNKCCGIYLPNKRRFHCITKNLNQHFFFINLMGVSKVTAKRTSVLFSSKAFVRIFVCGSLEEECPTANLWYVYFSSFICAFAFFTFYIFLIQFAQKLGTGAYKCVWLGYDTEMGIEVAWNTVCFMFAAVRINNISILLAWTSVYDYVWCFFICFIFHTWICILQVDMRRVPKNERKRLKGETEMLKSLKHPHIINFFNVWENKEEEQVHMNLLIQIYCTANITCWSSQMFWLQICFTTEIVTSGTLKQYIDRVFDKGLKLKIVKKYVEIFSSILNVVTCYYKEYVWFLIFILLSKYLDI